MADREQLSTPQNTLKEAVREATKGFLELGEQLKLDEIKNTLTEIEDASNELPPRLKRAVVIEVADAINSHLLHSNFPDQCRKRNEKTLRGLEGILISVKLEGIKRNPGKVFERLAELEKMLREKGVISGLQSGLDAVRVEMQQEEAIRRADEDILGKQK